MSSYWISSTQNLEKKYPTLTEDISVDVCIIGAGLVGITSAYFLSDSSLKVAILERNDICSHVSGNSTAKITSQHNLFYHYLATSYSQEFAKDYLTANQEAVARNSSYYSKGKDRLRFFQTR